MCLPVYVDNFFRVIRFMLVLCNLCNFIGCCGFPGKIKGMVLFSCDFGLLDCTYGLCWRDLTKKNSRNWDKRHLPSCLCDVWLDYCLIHNFLGCRKNFTKKNFKIGFSVIYHLVSVIYDFHMVWFINFWIYITIVSSELEKICG